MTGHQQAGGRRRSRSSSSGCALGDEPSGANPSGPPKERKRKDRRSRRSPRSNFCLSLGREGLLRALLAALGEISDETKTAGEQWQGGGEGSGGSAEIELERRVVTRCVLEGQRGEGGQAGDLNCCVDRTARRVTQKSVDLCASKLGPAVSHEVITGSGVNSTPQHVKC